MVTPLMFEHRLIDRAVADRRHIVLPEGEEERILRATDILLRRGVAELTLLGDPLVDQAPRRRAGRRRGRRSSALAPGPRAPGALRRGVPTPPNAPGRRPRRARAGDRGLLLLRHHDGRAGSGRRDGLRRGAHHRPHDPPGAGIRQTRPRRLVVSSVFFMCLPNQVLVYGDCAINPDPSAEELADIAIASAATAAAFGVEPRVAMLSYSTGSSGSGSDVEKVLRGDRLIASARPTCWSRAPSSTTPPSTPRWRNAKLPDSAVAGRATVFIFPDLNTGNNTYKAVQRSAGRRRGRPGPPGAAQAGQRPVPRRDSARHRQHGGDHSDPGQHSPSVAPSDGSAMMDQPCW